MSIATVPTTAHASAALHVIDTLQSLVSGHPQKVF